MNESIYICASSLCCCLVLSGILKLIAPMGKTRRIMSLVLSVFVLYCLLSAILSVIGNINLKSKENDYQISEEKFTIKYDDEVIKKTAEYLNEYVNGILESENILCADIKTVIGVDENKGIYIKEMNIYIDKKYSDRKDEVKDIVLSSAGINAMVMVNDYE